jgi:hypothetical protein
MSYDDNAARGLNEPIKDLAKERILNCLKTATKPIKYSELVQQTRYATNVSQKTAERLTRYSISELIIELNPIINDGADGYLYTNDVAKIQKMQQRQKNYRDKFDEKVKAFDAIIQALTTPVLALE